MVRRLQAVRREAQEHETRKEWPRTAPADPMIDAGFRLHADAREALLRFRDEKPFGLEPEPYVESLKTLFRTLAHVYDMPEPAVIHEGEWSGEASSSEYVPASHTIVLRGKRSVLTALHEFAHARGYGETGAVWWGVNAFRTTWPVSFETIAAKFTRSNGSIRESGLHRVMCARGRPFVDVPHVLDGVGNVDVLATERARAAAGVVFREPNAFAFDNVPEPTGVVDLTDPAPESDDRGGDVEDNPQPTQPLGQGQEMLDQP